MKKVTAVIPARYKSQRFPGKPLKKILGTPMIERVYRQVKRSGVFSNIIVGTDDKKIFNLVKSFGGNVKMTSDECRSGTDRVWDVVKDMDIDAVVNIQGDEPLISGNLLSDISNKLSGEEADVVTAAFFNRSLQDFRSENIVKTVISKSGKAIYFSRMPVPYCKDKDFSGFFHHIGIYGYTKEKLEQFVNLYESELEKRERLEQLRFIENDIDIYIIKTDYKSVGVDTPEDIFKIENILKGH